MPVSRRSILAAAVGANTLGLPGIVRAAAQTTLRFIPVIDLTFVDPIYAGAFVTRNHGFMVYDTLYGMNAAMEPSPQMLAGHVVSADARQWDLTLRDGLLWHDGTRVLARDCTASIRRWARRDAFATALLAATDELSAPDDRTIRFRLKRPFPLLPTALGKPALQAPFMMPERLATQDAFKPLTEVVGSGPFRFVADERIQGARNVYARFDGYQPRAEGKTEWTAGPKIVHYDRVVWTTMPDAATGAASLQSGEQDWQETAPHDLMPLLKKAPGVTTRILDPRGYTCMLRLNHLHPPFDNPAVRHAVLRAVDQSAFMTAVAGDDPQYQLTPLGYFAPGTPMASDAGLDIFRGPRDLARSQADIKAAGYGGEKVAILVPMNSTVQKPLGDVATDLLRRLGFDVDVIATDFGGTLQRQVKRETVTQGGWSAGVANWQGIDWLTPVGNPSLAGDGTAVGFYHSDRMEQLRTQWLQATDTAEQQRICRHIQTLAIEEVPYIPVGEYLQPTAYRSNITGILDGTAVFWNVRPG
jgi:peptide/nickel transport system substrate-binding protein